jgi:hypothetical protein
LRREGGGDGKRGEEGDFLDGAHDRGRFYPLGATSLLFARCSEDLVEGNR